MSVTECVCWCRGVKEPLPTLSGANASETAYGPFMAMSSFTGHARGVSSDSGEFSCPCLPPKVFGLSRSIDWLASFIEKDGRLDKESVAVLAD